MSIPSMSELASSLGHETRLSVNGSLVKLTQLCSSENKPPLVTDDSGSRNILSTARFVKPRTSPSYGLKSVRL